uniref:Cation channel sperm associated 2 n=1 Tax=Dromaius novaehollandiae TaxID=8790 RepID=A0A8C4JAM0_DRONO
MQKIKSQLLPRAEAIRSKLVSMFYLMDHLQGLSQAIPRHNIRDFLDPRKQRKLMLSDHNQLVRFNISPIRKTLVTPEKHLRSRIEVRSSRWPPLALWASWLLRSVVFRSFIIFLIFLNTLVLMVKSGEQEWPLLPVAVWVIAMIFIIDIALNWLVSFRGYWKSAWNIFDCTITFVRPVVRLPLSGVCGAQKRRGRLEPCVCRGVRWDGPGPGRRGHPCSSQPALARAQQAPWGLLRLSLSFVRSWAPPNVPPSPPVESVR